MKKSVIAFLLSGVGILQGCSPPTEGPPPGKANPPAEDSSTAGTHYLFDHPTAGSRIRLDSALTVVWHSSDRSATGLVEVSLYRNGEPVGALFVSEEPGDVDRIDLPVLLSRQAYRMGSGSGYRLRIASMEDGARWDFGPSFTLYSDLSGSLSVTEPTAGVEARADSVLRIAWSLTGDLGPRIGIQLYRDTIMVSSVTTEAAADSGAFTWIRTPGFLPSESGYRIRVFSVADPSIEAFGPAFTLTRPVWTAAYEILRPQAGEVWQAGEGAQVEWTLTGNPGPMTQMTLWRDSPREQVWGWTPSPVEGYSGPVSVPADLAGGTYRLRVGSYHDSTLFAFSPAFTVRAAATPAM